MKVDYLILGGGIAGLGIARELLAAGKTAAVVEKAPVVGGLARTIEIDGFRFDLGGHRFHSNNQAVVDWIKELLGDDLLSVGRSSRILMQGKFVDYPLQFPDALSAFPLLKGIRLAGSFFASSLHGKFREERSFEDWVVNRYGKALYEVFFRPYTEKVWGIKGHELSADWAAQRIGVPSLWRAMAHAMVGSRVTPKSYVTGFYYPRRGFGMIGETLQAQILAAGGAVLTEAQVGSLSFADDRVIATIERLGLRQTVVAKRVISTIPLPALIRLLGDTAPLPLLRYRDLMLVFLALKRRQVSGDTWTYFPEQRFTFGRLHEPKNWSADMVPDDSVTSLVLEIFASAGDEHWKSPDAALVDRVVGELAGIGWIDKSEILRAEVIRVPNAYPIYELDYREKLTSVHERLVKHPSLHLLGRTGSFHYMNSDGVIEEVFALLNQLEPHREAIDFLPTGTGRWV